MTLHLVNKTPAHSSALIECLQVLAETQEDSALLLIEDAVYAVLENNAVITKLKSLSFPCYVLQEDLQARGLLDKVPAEFKVVDYSGLVRLSLDYAKVQSWG